MSYRNGNELEACLMMSPLKWYMSQTTKIFIAREIMRKLLLYQISRYKIVHYSKFLKSDTPYIFRLPDIIQKCLRAHLPY